MNGISVSQAGLRQQTLGRFFATKANSTSSKEDLGRGAWILHRPSLWSASEADAITDHLIWRLPWQQREVLIHGRRVLQPRLIVYQAADPRLSYTYSRVKLNPEPWDAVVLAVKVKLGPVFSLTNGERCMQSGDLFPGVPMVTLTPPLIWSRNVWKLVSGPPSTAAS
ncbi:hypothetical protein ACKKBF_B01880 [Auxenochlorella protothecoides x Auxenochlorella symbiontica]